MPKRVNLCLERVHGGDATEQGGPGGRLPVHQVRQRRLGAGRTHLSAGQFQHQGKLFIQQSNTLAFPIPRLFLTFVSALSYLLLDVSSKMLIIITVIQFTLQLNGMQGRIIKRAATAPIRKVLGSIVVLAELPSVSFTLYELRGLGCVSLPTCPV